MVTPKQHPLRCLPMKYVVAVFITILLGFQLLACKGNSTALTTNNTLDSMTYDSFLNHLSEEKSTIKENDYLSAKAILFSVVDTMIPHYWVGTTWDFNGTSTEPKHGNIACGYFLTTTMKQTGYTINRVYMAQQASSVLIKSYCSDIRTMGSVAALKKYLLDQPDSSTYILGLDFHVGFVTKNKGEMYFIHSNYINREGVIREKIEESQALASNSFFMIGSMNANKTRVSEWMNW